MAASIETLWATLTTTAMLGTERRSLPNVLLAEPFTTLLTQLDADQPEQQVLGATAMAFAWRRAGWQALKAETSLPASSPVDRLPTCSSVAERHLATLLGGRAVLLPEWLELCATQRQRVPHHLLAELLEHGSNNPQLQSAIVAVIDQRGQWLATQNPAWSYVAVRAASDLTVLRQLWETETGTARIGVLRTIRGSDPALARELLLATWKSEQAAQRTALLETFATNLSSDDELLLEKMLDDRSREVRRVATRFLNQLPESQLCQRNSKRALATLLWSAPEPARVLGLVPGKAAKIDVQPPAVCTTEMQRDGIEPHSGTPRLGDRGWLLLQLVRATPPTVWTSVWQTNPVQIMTAEITGEWRKLLFGAWGEAAVQFGEIEWIEALLRYQFHELENDQIETLMQALPHATRDRLLIDLLKNEQQPLGGQSLVLPLLRTHRPHSAELGTLLLQRLQTQLVNPNNTDWYLRESLFDIARALPPRIVTDQVEDWLEGMRRHQFWEQTMNTLLDTIRFRRDMARALSQSPAT
jgi:hypothetical protein